MNALKHGILCKEICLKDENREEYEEFKNSLCTEFNCKSVAQQLLVEVVISCAWRLKRIYKIERHTIEGSLDGRLVLYVGADNLLNSYEKLDRYQISLEKRMFKALDELKKMQNGFVS